MKGYFSAALSALVLACVGCAPQTSHYYTDINDPVALRSYFAYSPERDVVISGHRGGMLAFYPENCIESFEKTLTMMPSFFEIDPRLTADSVIVLMHDKDLDRTTTGKGPVSDYTYRELQEFNLVDREGNVTPYKIPTLEECIEWSRGKAVLNLDIKDVPLDVMADFIVARKPANVIYTVRTAAQAATYCEKDPNAAFSVWCRNMAEFESYKRAGIEWSRVMVAYVGPSMSAEHAPLYDSLHSNGVMCMISVAPTHDRCYNDDCKTEGYKAELQTGIKPDIIETDYPYLFRNMDLSR